MRTFTREFELHPTLLPWRAIGRLPAQMDQAVTGSNDSYGTSYPRVDVYTDEDAAVVRAEVPGVPPDKIELSVEDDVLTLRGTRVADELPEGMAWRRQERGHGEFQRRMRLPFRIEAGAVDAQYENGVLQITLPRAEVDKPRKIAITAS
ncbi:MAG: Hsp20/alpha crystallin family protein [bacterium]